MNLTLMTLFLLAFQGRDLPLHHTLFAESGDVRPSEWSTLIKDINGNGLADLPGEMLRVTVRLTNHEDRPARAIHYEAAPEGARLEADTLRATKGAIRYEADGPVLELDRIAPNSHETLWFDVTLEGRMAAFDRVICQGTVHASGLETRLTDDPDTAASDDATVTFLEAEAAIYAAKRDELAVDLNGDNLPGPGDTLRYTVTLTNQGTGDAEGLVYSLGDTDNVALVTGSVTTTNGVVTLGNEPGDPTVVVTLGSLAPQGQATITYESRISDPLPAFVLTAHCQGTITGNITPTPTDDPDTLSFNDPTVTVLALAPLVEATKTDSLWVDANGNGVPNAGDTVRMTVRISNQGNTDAVSLTYNLAQAEYLNLEPGTVTTSQGTVTTGNEPGASTVQVSLGDLAVGEVVTITYDTLVPDPLPANVLEGLCQGRVSGTGVDVLTDDPDKPGSADATVVLFERLPLMIAQKDDSLQIDGDNDGLADPGDTLLYVITLRNDGNGTAEAVAFDSGFDPNTTLVTGSVTTTHGVITSGNNPQDVSVAVSAGDLAAGEEVTITCQVLIHGPPLPGVTEIRCQGVATGFNFDPRVTDDPSTFIPDDATVTPLEQTPLLIATKRDSLALDLNGNGQANFEDHLRYTVVITNQGTAMADQVVFDTGVDANTELLTGTVVTDQGVVVTGNQSGDQSVRVDAGDLAAGQSITITFDVRIKNPITSVTKASCQGRARSGALVALTDDPDTVAVSDATETELIPEHNAFVYASNRSEIHEDFDGDGRLDIGDTLMYQFEVRGGEPLQDVVLVDRLDPHTTLVPGSVATSQGIASVNEDLIRVDLGDVHRTAQVNLIARIAAFPQAANTIANQGEVSGLGFSILTDDPDTPEWMDPTIDRLDSTEVPTLGEVGLTVFTAALAGAGAYQMRQRRIA